MHQVQNTFTKVAYYQIAPKKTFEDRVLQIYDALALAQEKSLDFICFPEGFLTGYYDNFEEAFSNSIRTNEASFYDFLKKIQHFRPTLILGFIERSGEQVYNSAAVIEEGQVLHIQRKHYLYYDYFLSSSSFQAITSKGLQIGVVICLDSFYLEPCRLLAGRGAKIIFNPCCNKVKISHPLGDKPLYYPHFAARSFENHCWFVSADWVYPNNGKLICPGHSAIYNSNGYEVIRSSPFQEEIAYYSIPNGDLFEKKERRIYGSDCLKQQLFKT